MLRASFPTSYSLLRPCRTTVAFWSQSRSFHRSLSARNNTFEARYSEKLQRRAEEHGMSLYQLREKAKEKAKENRLREASQLPRPPSPPHPRNELGQVKGDVSSHEPVPPLSLEGSRKDSSPVKPLSSILNLPRILSSSRTITSEQVSALWTAYHASRSSGTGRGFLCASIPAEVYRKMTDTAAKYPTFVVPLPRLAEQEGLEEGKKENAYEFYYLQWDFHGVPSAPSKTANPDPFVKPSEVPKAKTDLQTTTLLFTPLQEYKLRATFATPYMVLTHYTDLVDAHGIVLLRGELTPASGSTSEGMSNYFLTQEDAQRLSMAVQKFYLWGEEGGLQELLRVFHEKPAEFEWEELLKHSELSA